MRIPLAEGWRGIPTLRWQQPCCCGSGRCRRGAGSLAGGASAARPRPRQRPPAPGAGLGELSTEGGAEGTEEAEGRGHLRCSPPPNFLPAFCSHFAPAELREGVGCGEWRGEGEESCGEREAAMGEPDWCVC